MTELLLIVSHALKELYARDIDLFERRVHERSVVFRFGLYFAKLIEYSEEYLGYDLDFDYNRNMEGSKTTEKFPHGIYPDLILHRRRSNQQNVLALEFKTFWNQDNSDDIEKLIDLTSPDQQYGFRLGISIVLGRDQSACQFTFVEDGRVLGPAESKDFCRLTQSLGGAME